MSMTIVAVGSGMKESPERNVAAALLLRRIRRHRRRHGFMALDISRERFVDRDSAARFRG